jgi:hypothetical protein
MDAKSGHQSSVDHLAVDCRAPPPDVRHLDLAVAVVRERGGEVDVAIGDRSGVGPLFSQL